jgi:hypothetical protein
MYLYVVLAVKLFRMNLSLISSIYFLLFNIVQLQSLSFQRTDSRISQISCSSRLQTCSIKEIVQILRNDHSIVNEAESIINQRLKKNVGLECYKEAMHYINFFKVAGI